MIRKEGPIKDLKIDLKTKNENNDDGYNNIKPKSLFQMMIQLSQINILKLLK